MKALNAEQEKDVERVRQREELLAKVFPFSFVDHPHTYSVTIKMSYMMHLQAETMKKKLPWLKYDMKKAEYMEAKEKEKDGKKKLDEAARTLNDLREPIEYTYYI